MRRRMTIAAAMAAAALIAGCGSEPAASPEPPPSASPSSAPPGPVAPVPAVSAAGLELGHVHTIALDGDAVLLGTHGGLYRQVPGQAPVLLAEPFDVMGFASDGARWLASGHPAAGSAGHGDLGLLESTDGGATWRTVALAGEADFHRLAVSGSTVLGVNSGDGMLWRSADGGRSWTTHGPGPFDVALDGSDAQRALATMQTGPMVSGDGGQSFAALPGAPLIAYVAWTDRGIVAAAPDGAILRSADGGATWQRTGAVPGRPAGLAAHGDRVVVLQGGTVWESVDTGATFTARIVELPAG